MRLPKQQDLSERTVKLHRWVITACLMAVLVPSIWQGYRFVQHEYFRSAANVAVKTLMQSERSIVRREIDADQRSINLVVVGVVDERALKERAMNALTKRGITHAEVSVLRPDSAMWEEQKQRGTDRDDAIHLLVDRIEKLQQQVTDLQKIQSNTAVNTAHHYTNSVHKGK